MNTNDIYRYFEDKGISLFDSHLMQSEFDQHLEKLGPVTVHGKAEDYQISMADILALDSYAYGKEFTHWLGNRFTPLAYVGSSLTYVETKHIEKARKIALELPRMACIDLIIQYEGGK